MSFKYISLKEILRLHFQLIEDFGGSHGVRDEGRLMSDIEAPKLEAFGVEQYPTVFENAAVYLRNIIGDHPFTDSNKRTAVTVCGIFLRRNSHPMSPSPRELEDFALKSAIDRLEITQIANWLREHTK